MTVWFSALLIFTFTISAHSAETVQRRNLLPKNLPKISDATVTVLKKRPRTSPNCCGLHNGVDCDARSIQGTAEEVACRADFEKNKCEAFKATLESEDLKNMIDCSDPKKNSFDALSLMVSCGGGLINFVVDTVTGVLQIPGMINAAIDAANEHWDHCESDPKYKETILAPIRMTLSDDEFKRYMDMDCVTMTQMKDNAVQNIENIIHNKINSFEPYVNGQPVLNEGMSFTPEELAYRAAQQANDPDIIGALMKQLNGQLMCYTPNAKAALACEIAATLVTSVVPGGALLKGLGVSSKVLGILTAIRDEVLLTRIEKYGDGVSDIFEHLDDGPPVCATGGHVRSLGAKSFCGSPDLPKPNPLTVGMTTVQLSKFNQMLLALSSKYPSTWTKAMKSKFEEEIAKVAKMDSFTHQIPRGEPSMNLESIEKTLCPRTPCKPPTFVAEGGGKLKLVYDSTDGAGRVYVKINTEPNNYYLTFTRLTGYREDQVEYLQLNTRGRLEPCDWAAPLKGGQCHFPIDGLPSGQ